MSRLIDRLEIKTESELLSLMGMNVKKHSKLIAIDVIFNGMTYEAAGEKFGITKNAVYELLKRIYKKKHGVKYSD